MKIWSLVSLFVLPLQIRRLAYFDPAHGVFVVIDGTSIWAYRYRT